MDNLALQKISYGLYVVTAKSGNKSSGCIVNTVMQAASSPVLITVSVNKQNFTHDLILREGKFNVSVLTEDVPFDMIKRFGFSSGRDTDKFDGLEVPYTADGIAYIDKYTNSYLACTVKSTVDCGTHTLFVAEVTDAKCFSDAASLTYDFYHKNVKPKAEPVKGKKVYYQCTVCGYIYEGDTLPEDFVCPLCKHGAADFVKVES
jgi:flavin reductase (DIM6/NTAB) family NADH-FMN oxidoreductase RutF